MTKNNSVRFKINNFFIFFFFIFSLLSSYFFLQFSWTPTTVQILSCFATAFSMVAIFVKSPSWKNSWIVVCSRRWARRICSVIGQENKTWWRDWTSRRQLQSRASLRSPVSRPAWILSMWQPVRYLVIVLRSDSWHTIFTLYSGTSKLGLTRWYVPRILSGSAVNFWWIFSSICCLCSFRWY